MIRTLTRSYASYNEAQAVANKLEAADIEGVDISIVGKQSDLEETRAAEGAGIGGVIGGAAGVLAGVGLLAIPGVGPVVAAGWLASTVAGIAVGAVAGGLVGTLVSAGIDEGDAHYYAETIRRGGSVVAVKVDEGDVATYLGKPKFRSDVAERVSAPGVATGLAWTPVGGDILFIETSRMKGKGRLEITGQLGDVMKESARAALTFVKGHADELGFAAEILEDADLHIHVPAGGIPKDGPSAGVTIFTALASLLSGRRVRSDTAMTGECTLRGRVLPVGGIKSKVLAAHRAGITRVILPRDNERDLDEVPADVRSQIEFILADDMRKVLEAALESDAIPSEVARSASEASPVD